MSSSTQIFNKGIHRGSIVTFAKRFVVNFLFLQIWKLFAMYSASGTFQVSSFDIPCTADSNCSMHITGKSICNNFTGMCSCADGSVRMHQHYYCLKYAGVGEDCQVHEQCMHRDLNVICSTWSQRCQCRSGYEHRETNNSTKLCARSRMIENESYMFHLFSGLDPVHIVLGCLTGGLALLACFAGIAQLARKKYRRHRCNDLPNSEFTPDLGFSTASVPSQSQPFTDSQYTAPPSGGDFSFLNGGSTAPPTPGTLGDDDYVVTPPPTYEEAVQSERNKAASTITV